MDFGGFVCEEVEAESDLMDVPVILELRGDGVLVRVNSMKNGSLRELEKLAINYKEELSIAWFDPAFRWSEKVRNIMNKVTSITEYRGLFVHDRSFMEVRKPKKSRRKFAVTELLAVDQLFPLTRSVNFSLPELNRGEEFLIEVIYGTGCLGKFEIVDFRLDELELEIFQSASTSNKYALLSRYAGMNCECSNDDFVVRGNDLMLSQ